MLRTLCGCFIGIFVYLSGLTQTIRIGISPTKKFTHIKFNNATASYAVVADSFLVGYLNKNNSLEVLVGTKGKVDLFFSENRKKGFSKVKLIAVSLNHSLDFSSISPVFKSKAFEGDFEITATSDKLLVVNELDNETYLEGVLESEGGQGQTLEYYKVQAIISRSFAKRAFDKHSTEGFNLCNQVHCQAYLHKRMGSSMIDSAVNQTKNQVLFTQDGAFAPTFFSANCGGETCNPAFVWNEEMEGLVPLRDTFCTKTKQATWVKTLDPTVWKTFFVEKYAFPVDDSVSYHYLFHQELNHRKAFFIHPGYGIPMRDIREKFELKSSYFSVKLENNQVVLHGKGYGHGVGLCQEGAMAMAKKGFYYTQILGYYFPNFHLKVIQEQNLWE